MTGSIIRHRIAVGSTQPNLRSYEATRASFSWEQAERQELAGLPGGRGINIVHDEERYRRCFAGGWYLTGDLARRDEDGYFWFVGRADDVIKSAGHLIGPFEVESVLLEHPAVAEAGAIGKPDPVVGEVVKAFIALKPGFVADEGDGRDVR